MEYTKIKKQERVRYFMGLTGKIALVTGASRGIGRAIAIALAKEGAIIAINYSKDEMGIEETKNIIINNGGYVRVYKGDVSDYNQIKIMISQIVKDLGGIDILVNNAGRSKIGLFCDMNEEDWDYVMDTNLKGIFNCTKNVISYMISKKQGNIINISSIWGSRGASCEVIYSAAKGGVDAFTRSLALELAPSNIRVNAISPGVIDTSMNSNLNKEDKEALKHEIPLERFGSSEEVGKLAVFLAEDKSNYITGQVITIDGGFTV
jgi:3-oxoacyl-[acyl-carrier protein] reductase